MTAEVGRKSRKPGVRETEKREFEGVTKIPTKWLIGMLQLAGTSKPVR